MDFLDALKNSKYPIDECIRYLLVWMAAADGDFDNVERDWIRENFSYEADAISIEQLVEAVQRRDPAFEVCALSVIRETMDRKNRELVLELALGVAIADGRVMHSEIHALRFVADALEIPPDRFSALYRSEANTDAPEPPDLSDPSFWEQAEFAARQREAPNSRHDSWNSNQIDAKTRESLATLGLDSGATSDEIKQAYRHLAAVHHPDRFGALGETATATATKTFQRIKAAYDHLQSANSLATHFSDFSEPKLRNFPMHGAFEDGTMTPLPATDGSQHGPTPRSYRSAEY